MKKLLTIALVGIGFLLNAQTDSTKMTAMTPRKIEHDEIADKPEKKGQWVFGGDIGAGFGSGTSIRIAPEVGYRLNNGLEMGVGAGYNFYSYDYSNNLTYKSNFFNVGPYVSYDISQMFFVKAQYQYLGGTQKQEYLGYEVSNDISENALWLGGGYQNRIGNNAFYKIGFMYNVLYDKDDSIYGSGFMPVVGISFGL